MAYSYTEKALRTITPENCAHIPGSRQHVWCSGGLISASTDAGFNGFR